MYFNYVLYCNKILQNIELSIKIFNIKIFLKSALIS
jgi:hypothetical protein